MLDSTSSEQRLLRHDAETTLSLRLRTETGTEHSRTEEAFAFFTADPAAHLSGFLAAQLVASRALAAARDGAPVAEEGRLLADLIEALSEDCADAGHAPLPDLAVPRRLDTLAVGYLALGARLGSAVLARQVTEAGLALPRAFTLTAPQGAWRAFRQRLDTHSQDPVRAERVIADARAGFDLHRAAAARVWTISESATT
ncbi:hypothetical protein ROJ8625_03795 [Roseivivax jejudonensis]|uniref:Heme oxygenase n=1 Tax=Roseivivax jejudonensis TaxID=1529041 RepID=A0A1X7A7M5_9RHOB|nr:hypothetical protein [Roseivivax jejudonensis]SLN72108.1 hypothetical protein ROJ8625_03795 [Roseivivax jejudonensis]